MITKGQRVKVICSEARLKEVGVRQKHIKHILGKIGTVKEIRKLPNTDDMYAYFVHFRYVNLKAAPGNKKPYYAMLDDMIDTAGTAAKSCNDGYVPLLRRIPNQ